MNDEIQLISDGDGLAVIGESGAVDRFLMSQGMEGVHLGRGGLPVRGAVGWMGAATAAGATIAENSGRWMKLAEESYEATKHLPLVKNATTGLVHATVRSGGGQFAKNLQFVAAPAAVLNPAAIATVGALMSQMALQKSIDEINDYLAEIDAKVDDILRAQKDSVLADMIGVDLIIEEVMIARDAVGRVSEVMWSKVQGCALTIASTQAYALRQLDAIAERIEAKGQLGDLAEAAKIAEIKVPEWLAVLARCFQLQDSLAVLELDRVLDAAPDELDRHRLGLKTARTRRLALMTECSAHLLARMAAAAGFANRKVLLHPVMAHEVVTSSNQVSSGVANFHGRLGIDREQQAFAARRWVEAVADVRDQVVETGTGGVAAAKETATRAASAFRSVDLDGDGIPDQPQALIAARNAGSVIKGRTTGAAEAVGSLFRRRKDGGGPEELDA